MTALGGMLRTDARRMARDRFLIAMVLYIVGISVAMRWILPWLASELLTRTGFELTPYYTLIVSHLVIQLTPLASGIVGAFLLLEARETRMVRALLVAPVPLTTYLALLGSVLLLSAAALSVMQGAVIGLAVPPWPALIGASVAGAPSAVAMALFVGGIAGNKTEAVAYLKICGTLPLIPSAAYFLPEPWQWIATVYPPYWASKAYWIAHEGGNWALWVVGGGALSALWMAALGKFFLTTARRT